MDLLHLVPKTYVLLSTTGHRRQDKNEHNPVDFYLNCGNKSFDPYCLQHAKLSVMTECPLGLFLIYKREETQCEMVYMEKQDLSADLKLPLVTIM